MHKNPFEGKKILILGDVMLDQYVFGSIRGQSPEANVPVIDYRERTTQVGGAANVALNVSTLGGHAILLGVVGEDAHGKKLENLLSTHENIEALLIKSHQRITTSKTRIIADDQHQLRFDEEDRHALTAEEMIHFQQNMDSLDSQSIDAIILQDYNKGVLTPQTIEYVSEWASAKYIPVLVDPKIDNISSYHSVHLLKPNDKELSAIKKKVLNSPSEIKETASEVIKELGIENMVVTMGSQGSVFLSADSSWGISPPREIELVDVCGAGDAVISTLALCVAIDFDLETSALLANIAGSICCEYLGVYAVRGEQLWSEYQKCQKQTK